MFWERDKAHARSVAVAVAAYLRAGAAVVAQPRKANADNQHDERHTDDDDQHGGVRRLDACAGIGKLEAYSKKQSKHKHPRRHLTFLGDRADACTGLLHVVRVDHRMGEHVGVWLGGGGRGGGECARIITNDFAAAFLDSDGGSESTNN